MYQANSNILVSNKRVMEVMISGVCECVSINKISLECLDAASLFLESIMTYTIARWSLKIKVMWPKVHI